MLKGHYCRKELRLVLVRLRSVSGYARTATVDEIPALMWGVSSQGNLVTTGTLDSTETVKINLSISMKIVFYVSQEILATYYL